LPQADRVLLLLEDVIVSMSLSASESMLLRGTVEPALVLTSAMTVVLFFFEKHLSSSMAV
jgi:hypothetical protein